MTAARVNFRDVFAVDGLRKTADGYLTANVRVARTGVQVYKGRELGRPDLGDVNVYRPESEVFAKDAMASLAHRPVTLYHPTDSVNSQNWKRYAKGQTGDEVVRDGDHIRVPMVLMDKAAVDAVEKEGINELSVGYSTELKWGKGTTEDGKPFDATQTDIRANHLAIVPVARGGSTLRVGDAQKVCPKCGEEVADGKATCPTCKFKFNDGMQCNDCGSVMVKDAKFCSDCGKAASVKDGMPPKTCPACGEPMHFYALKCPKCQTPMAVDAAPDGRALYWIVDKDFSEERRKELTKSGAAMPGGRFPIVSAGDVTNAVRDYNRIGQPANVKAHIIARAKAIGATASLPDDWKASDSAPNRGTNMTAIVTIDGAPVQVADELSAKVIENKIAALTAKLRDADAEAEKMKKSKKDDDEAMDKKAKDAVAALQTKDGQIAVLTKQIADATMTPAKLDALVKDRSELIAKASAIVDAKSFVFDGKSDAEIRRAVVSAKLGDAATKAMEDPAIMGAFAALTVNANDGFKGGGARDLGFALQHQRSNGMRDTGDIRDAAFDAHEKRLNNAWRTPPGQQNAN